jgi:hypothetical protein
MMEHMKETQMRLGLAEGLKDGWAVTGSSLAEVVEERTDGVSAMLHVLTYIALWGRFTEQAGREPASILELSTAMRMPNKTLWRWAERFAESFPELESPAPLWELVRGPVSDDLDRSPAVLAMKLGAVQL